MLFMIPVGLIVLVVIGYVIWRGLGWGGGCAEDTMATTHQRKKEKRLWRYCEDDTLEAK